MRLVYNKFQSKFIYRIFKSRGVQSQNFLTRIMNSLFGWLPLRLSGSAHTTVPGSGVSLVFQIIMLCLQCFV